MSFTLCTLGEAIADAGIGANFNYPTSGANMIKWSNQVEAEIAVDTLKDWVTDNDFSAQTSGALAMACSARIANKAISYDTSGFLSRAEAELAMDFNDDNYKKGIKELREKNKAQDFMT